MKFFGRSSLFAVVCTVVALGSPALADKKASKQEIAACEAILAKDSKSGKVDLHVTISHVQNTDGHVLVAIFDDRCGGFPEKK